MVSPGGDLFFCHSKFVITRFFTRLYTFRVYGLNHLSAWFEVLFTRLHDKNGSFIFIIYNIYTLYIPIINFYYVYIYNKSCNRVKCVSMGFESCSNRVKIVYQIV